MHHKGLKWHGSKLCHTSLMVGLNEEEVPPVLVKVLLGWGKGTTGELHYFVADFYVADEVRCLFLVVLGKWEG